MINYLISLEVLLAIFSIVEMYLSPQYNLFGTIFFLLLYLSIKMIYYIFIKYKKNLILLVCEILIIIIMYSLFDAHIIYFLAINMFLLLKAFDINPNWSLVSIFFVFFIDPEYVVSFLMTNTFSILYLDSVFKLIENRDYYKVLTRDLRKQKQDLTDKIFLYQGARSNLEYQIKLEERNQIAQALHDELGHTLSGSTMQLEALKLLLDTDKDKATEYLDSVIQNLPEGTTSIRNILKDLKPETKAMNISNIKKLVSEFSEETNILVDLVYDSSLHDFNSQTWNIIYLNIKESLTNSLKYARASKIKIEFTKLNKMFKISITDDGVGSYVIKKGLGLRGMEERMASINSKLIVDGSHGFSIIMIIPTGG